MEQTFYFSGDWHFSEKFYTYYNAFECVGFDSPWNGFVTPIVSRGQLDALVACEDDLSVDVFGRLVYHNAKFAITETITPDPDGLFHLSQLGWCFVELTEEEYEDVI